VGGDSTSNTGERKGGGKAGFLGRALREFGGGKRARENGGAERRAMEIAAAERREFIVVGRRLFEADWADFESELDAAVVEGRDVDDREALRPRRRERHLSPRPPRPHRRTPATIFSSVY